MKKTKRMDKIFVKQIDGRYIDLGVSDKFKEHYAKNNTYSDYIINKEINAGLYSEPILDGMFNDNPVVIDAGANVGLFTIYILPMVGRVYCIEPTPSHFEVLKDLLCKVGGDVVEFHQIALHNYDGECNFKIIDKNTTENKVTEDETGVVVKCLTLKSFFEENNIDQIDLLKMDIEGGENSVLMEDDTVDWALNKCNMIYIETHPRPFGKIKERDLIRKMGRLNFKHIAGRRTFSHYFFK